MKKVITGAALAICALGVSSSDTYAGNKDRIGQSGATELLINPWGRSTGMFGLNTAQVGGIESIKTNIAGLAGVESTEIGVAYSAYLRGSNVGVNNLGFAQKLGDFGVVGLNIMSMTFGDIVITNFDNPDGQIGTYKPQFFNATIGFAKDFSNSIRAGVGATFISEQISNVKANGAAFEAGIQYVTGKRDNFHFGITLRNIGTNMRFAGTGFSINSEAPNNENYLISRETPSEKFEMPTYLNFGAAYDFFLDENRLKSDDAKPQHRATVMANFTSHSFNNDQLGLGVEYAYKEMFMVRAAYRYENGINSTENTTTFYNGFSTGASVQKQIGDDGPKLAIDYSYRPTFRPNNGVHTVGIRFMR